ncbi:MAG TPA: hypothetical protein VHM28_10700 [Anaerolineales bacterium]|nr:hypothetical protein [Anaerolineales bacterium]
MIKPIHAEITRRALSETFSPRALDTVVAANLGQDALSGQVGHDEFHFDNNAFDKSRAYIKAQRDSIRPALERGDIDSARSAFGRLTHAAQDFYAHSNYIDLWSASQPNGKVPAAAEIDALDNDLLFSPDLRSGKLYYPLEVLSFIRPLRKFVLPLIPRDSHAWMNLDSAERGPKFEYAYQAAIQRTRYEFNVTTRGFPVELNTSFTGLARIA